MWGAGSGQHSARLPDALEPSYGRSLAWPLCSGSSSREGRPAGGDCFAFHCGIGWSSSSAGTSDACGAGWMRRRGLTEIGRIEAGAGESASNDDVEDPVNARVFTAPAPYVRSRPASPFFSPGAARTSSAGRRCASGSVRRRSSSSLDKPDAVVSSVPGLAASPPSGCRRKNWADGRPSKHGSSELIAEGARRSNLPRRVHEDPLSAFVSRFPHRILNIHPRSSLPFPAYMRRSRRFAMGARVAA